MNATMVWIVLAVVVLCALAVGTRHRFHNIDKLTDGVD